MSDQFITTPPGGWNKKDIDNLAAQVNFALKTIYANIGGLINSNSNFDVYQMNGATVMYATSAPSGGTYKTGSRVYNTVPTSGYPIFWVCTSGGTPGVWEVGPRLG